ncbi:MAG TPA: hypothetical protein VFT74_11700, partial [Isosphaeraceae bacterium]|nr:hypothetical protein [Isosphaeraceae bacterium]
MTAWKPSTDLTIAAALGLGMLAVYLANGRSAGGGDVVPATLASVALTRGDGPFLDRFAPLIRDDSGRLPGYAEDSRGRAVSRYPVGPALLAAPLVWPQVRVLDHARPGWEHQGEITLARCDRMAKNAAAFLTAAAVALSWSLLRAIGLGRTPALLACLIAALGSGYWPVASQALWQHGPAALCLTAALGLLTSGFEGPIQPSSAWVRRRFRRFGRWTGFGTVALETLPQTHGDEVAATNLRAGFSSLARLSLAGAFSAMLVACRPIDAVFSVALGLWVLAYFPRRGRWAFFAPAVIGAFVLIGYNLYFFDTITGGYAKIEQMHPWAHGTKGTFTGSLIEGGFGTLLSPSHGLWVYCPWVLVVTVSLAIPSVRRRLWSDCSPIGWLSGSLVPYFALL